MRKRDNTATQVDHVLGGLRERGDPGYDFAVNKWAVEMRVVNRKASRNGIQTQALSVARVTLTIPVPLLAGLALHGNGATLVRWLTFVLSLTAAIAAAYVTIRGYEPRWRLYHKYADKILSEGWLYLENAGKYETVSAQRDQSELAALFAEEICGIVTAMNQEYDAIAHASATAQNPAAAV
jgi:hypothetical protein